MKRTNNIELKIELDENNVPDKITWQASEAQPQWQNAKAFVLALFDEDKRDTLRIDLWTKDMQMIEMDRFVYHIINSLSDTYVKATNNHDLGNKIKSFAQFFGEETQILKKN